MYRDDLIRAKKAAKKLTIEDLVTVTGLNKNTISDICNGKDNPELNSLKKVAEALDIDLETLFSKSRRRLAA